MSKALTKLQSKLDQRVQSNSFRSLKTSLGLVDFYSNDYLGLSSNTHVIEQVSEELARHKLSLGSTGSRLLSGNDELTVKLEEILADHYKSDEALLFNSGYAANTAVLQSIPQRGDTIIYDELIHASLKEGARLSFADRFSFKHNDLEDLERKIQKSQGEVYVVIESVYSMDGDNCPLLEIVELAKKYEANIILDEAHSTGIMGEKGSGMAVQMGVHQDVLIRVHTFGKAMGCHGAVVVGHKTIKDYLINFALSFIYTTALPQHSVVSIHCIHNFLSENYELTDALMKNIQLFNSETEGVTGYINSSGPIKAICVPGNDNVKSLAVKLQVAGYDVRPILSPTVKKGQERLRICLHSFNSREEIEGLCNLIKEEIK